MPKSFLAHMIVSGAERERGRSRFRFSTRASETRAGGEDAAGPVAGAGAGAGAGAAAVVRSSSPRLRHPRDPGSPETAYRYVHASKEGATLDHIVGNCYSTRLKKILVSGSRALCFRPEMPSRRTWHHRSRKSTLKRPTATAPEAAPIRVKSKRGV